MFQCDSKKCINGDLRNDGIINCPPPRCLDEKWCRSRYSNVFIVSKKEKPTSFPFLPIVIVVVTALAMTICCYMLKKTSQNLGHVEQPQPTIRPCRDSYVGLQNMPMPPQNQHQQHQPFVVGEKQLREPMTLVPSNQQHVRPMPTAPPIEPMPSVSPNQQRDRPMPSGVNLEDPPPYHSLFIDDNKRL